MKPELKGIRLTIIELFGAFLPGLVWCLLFTIVIKFVVAGKSISTPLDVAHRYIAMIDGKPTTAAAVAIVAMLIGFALNASPLIFAAADRLSLAGPFPYAHVFDSPESSKSRKRSRKKFFESVCRLVDDDLRKQFACHSHGLSDELPGDQPFNACKYMIKLLAPELWDELDRAESKVSFLASLFGAAMLSSLLSLTAWAIERPLHVGWLLPSVAAAVYFGWSYRSARRHEVESIYLWYLLCKSPARPVAAPPATSAAVAS